MEEPEIHPSEPTLASRMGAQASDPGGLQVVLSAAGSLGRAVLDSLASGPSRIRGVVFDPSLVERSYPAAIEIVSANPQNASSLAETFRGATVVYDCFEPRFSNWKHAIKEVTCNALSAPIEAGASLVFASHLLVSEVDNVALESDLLNAHDSNLTKTAVARMPQIYGPRVVNVLWEHIFECAIRGKKAHWLGDLDVPRNLLYVDDAARMMTLIGRSPGAYGRRWNLSGPEPITGRRIMELAYRAAGREPRIGSWGRGIMMTGRLLGSDAKEFLELPYDYYKPFILDGSEFAEAFPSTAYTTHPVAVERTIQWFRAVLEKGPQSTDS